MAEAVGLPARRPRPAAHSPASAVGDIIFRILCQVAALVVLLLAGSLLVVLLIESWPFFSAVGFDFLRVVPWNPGGGRLRRLPRGAAVTAGRGARPRGDTVADDSHGRSAVRPAGDRRGVLPGTRPCPRGDDGRYHADRQQGADDRVAPRRRGRHDRE